MIPATAPLTIPTEIGDIHISAEKGEIHVDAVALTHAWGTEFLDRLLAQAVGSNSIDSVAVDRALGTATIRYDDTRWEISEALSEIATMLNGQACGPESEPEVTLNLHSIPGIVTRVDRVRTVTETAQRGASPATFGRWLARLSPFRNREGRASKSGETARTAAVMQGVIIHYTPVEPTIAPSDLAELPAIAEIPVDEPGVIPLIGATENGITENGLQRHLPIQGWRRAANLAAAGGCFLMSVVGFITPGIPTVPFVLATSHFLVRSTPALNDRLRESRLFGAIVRDWEDQGGMRQSTKVRTLLLMLGVLGTTAILSGGSLPVLMMTSAVGGIDLLVVMAIPTVAEEAGEPTPPRLEYQLQGA